MLGGLETLSGGNRNCERVCRKGGPLQRVPIVMVRPQESVGGKYFQRIVPRKKVGKLIDKRYNPCANVNIALSRAPRMRDSERRVKESYQKKNAGRGGKLFGYRKKKSNRGGISRGNCRKEKLGG